MSVFEPKAFKDYVMGVPVPTQRDVTVQATPQFASSASLILWSVRDAKTPSAALKIIKKTSKSLFPHNSASVTVGGTAAYFGTDGTQFATVAFARGRYWFEVLVTANKTAPKNVRDVALRAAQAFPTPTAN
jgi:hypothetical protein